MPLYAIGTGSRNSPTAKGYDGARMVNYFMHPDPTGSYTQGIAFQRSMLKRLSAAGGPVRGMVSHKGVIYFAAGGSVFSVNAAGTTTFIDSIGGAADEYVPMVSTATQMALIAGGEYYSGAGNPGSLVVSTTGEVSTPRDLAYEGGYIFVIGDNASRGDVIAASGLNNFASFTALHFATGESDSDDAVAIKAVNGQVWVLGERTIEAWYLDGTDGFPMSPNRSAFMNVGVKLRESVVMIENQAYWISPENHVYRSAGGQPQRISDPLTEEALSGADVSTCFAMTDRGHQFYVIGRTDGPALAFNVRTGLWSEFTSGGENDAFIATHSASLNGVEYFGTSSNAIANLNRNTFTDDGRTVRREIVTPKLATDGEFFPVDSIRLHMASGDTDIGRNPVVNMQSSRDGVNWTDARPRKLGRIGERRGHPEWRGLGTFEVAQFRFWITDPVLADVYGSQSG